MRGFLRVLLFVAIGPYVGLLTFALGIGLWTLVTTGSMRDFTFGPELLSPGILIVTYTVGGIPALIDGIGATILARWVSSWPYRGWVALLGAAMGALAVVLIGGGELGLSPGASGLSPVTVLLTLAGGVAGFVCALTFDGLAGLGKR